MSKSTRTLLAVCMLAFVAACAQPQEEVVITEPVTAEPVYTGKYN
jgi:hypothetical protein